MHQFSSKVFFKLVVLLNGYEFVQSTIHTGKNNEYNNFAPDSHSIPAANNINNFEWQFHNKTKVNLFQENLRNYQQNPATIYNKLKPGQFEWSNGHHVEEKFEVPGMMRQFLRRKPDWPQASSWNMFDAQQQLGNLQDKQQLESSDDHLKKRHLADYNEPSPAILEMPPNLHHHLPLIVYKTTAKTVSHATSNEPSPVTTETIKTLASIKTFNEEKITINNKLNYYDTSSNAITASRSAASKQFLHAPMRSAWEKELSYATNVLPYPPSFIYITTTETPAVLNYNTVENNKMPDFFTHRQFKSLWDSYIPSWQTMKFMQKLRINSNRNNLQTLAFTKDGKKKIEK